MPTISVLFPNELQHKLRRRAIEAGITQRALIPQLLEQALGKEESVEPIVQQVEAVKETKTPSERSKDETEVTIQLGPDPDGRNAVCGLCGARYKPNGITVHIRQSHPEVE